MTGSRFKSLLTLVRPHFLLGGVLLYALGGGIARYLGQSIDWQVFWVGVAWWGSFQLGCHLLYDYFQPAGNKENPGNSIFPIDTGSIYERRQYRDKSFSLIIAVAFTITAVMSVYLIVSGRFSMVLFLITAVSILSGVLYSTPPVKLVTTGYGELILSILAGGLVPAFAFLLQADQPHRLLSMTTLPLIPLHIALVIIYEFPNHASDLKSQTTNLLVRLGWQSGIHFHHILVMASFLMFAIALLIGLPFRIGIWVFLVLPLGLVQIWYLNRIGSGVKPNWRALKLAAVVLFYLPAYLLTFSYWIN